MRWRGVRDDEASVCTKHNEEGVYEVRLGRLGEVGCEKNVYRGDERRGGMGVGEGYKVRGGG
ncbi:hypothetical protein PMAC_003411 [Pneumocystis sp. 'macacae']|nr:hypothetical protein PMAC_003411 [Pneumocystis sp. 'macacae']